MSDMKSMIREEFRDLYEKNLFQHHNFIELERIERDYAVAKLDIRSESKNGYGMIHGGALYTMADNAAGTAAMTDHRLYVTLEGNLHFLRSQTEGTVRAEARVRHRGKSTCLVNVDIVGEGGKLLATGEFSFFCMDKSVMDKKFDTEARELLEKVLPPKEE